MANRDEVFTAPGGGTTTNEIAVGSDALYTLQIPASGMEGTNVAVYGKVRADQAAVKPVYSWSGTTRTQIKLTGVAAGDLLWFPTPIDGLHSIALVVDSQTGDSIITPSWRSV